jgi:hypothetical protein
MMKSGIPKVRALMIFGAGLLLQCTNIFAGSPTPSASPSQKMMLQAMPIPPLPASIRPGFVGNSQEAFLVAGEASRNSNENLKIWSARKTELGYEWKQENERAPHWAATAQWKDSLICAGGLEGASRLLG